MIDSIYRLASNHLRKPINVTQMITFSIRDDVSKSNTDMENNKLLSFC